jgi:hypothetical protein
VLPEGVLLVAAERRTRWTIEEDALGDFYLMKGGVEVAGPRTRTSCIALCQTRFHSGDSVVVKHHDGHEEIITRRVARR